MQRHRIKITWAHPEIETQKEATRTTNKGMRTVSQTQGHRDNGSKIKRHESKYQTLTERWEHKGSESFKTKHGRI